MAETMWADLRTKILAASAVSTLIIARFYPDLIPQDVTYPCANMVIIGGTEEPTLTQGSSGLASDRVQINAWATTRNGAIALAEAIREAILGYRGTTGTTVFASIFIEGRFRTFYEDEVQAWQVQQDFLVTHEVTRP